MKPKTVYGILTIFFTLSSCTGESDWEGRDLDTDEIVSDDDYGSTALSNIDLFDVENELLNSSAGVTQYNDHNEARSSALLEYIIYSPFSGVQGGQDQYCNNGGDHSIVWADSPSDLLTGGNTAVYFNANQNIKSIQVTHYNNTCSSAPANQDYIKQAVRVDIFCGYNGAGYIGSAYYGHLGNRINEGIYNSPSHLYIGSTGNWWGTWGSCYQATNYQHIHMESNGWIYPRACWTNITQSTPIYRWRNECNL